VRAAWLVGFYPVSFSIFSYTRPSADHDPQPVGMDQSTNRAILAALVMFIPAVIVLVCSTCGTAAVGEE
jgi:hypothetical protein